MLRYTLRRLGTALVLMLFVSFVAFILVFAAGDPAVKLAGEAGTAADAARLRAAYGFDRPILVQFAAWLANALHGNLGYSLYFDQPVSAILPSRLAVTLTLGALAIAFALLLAVPLGILAARFQNTIIDRLALLFAVVGQAMPTFWFALMLVILLSVTFQILPTSGTETWAHFVMPTIVLGYFAAPAIMRLTRSGMIAALEADYIRTARAMGLSTVRVLFKYALRNAVVPVVSVAAAQFGNMLAGSVVVESVFAVNGAGRLAWESVLRSDLPTVQALVLSFSLLYVALTFAADIINAWLDPRMRLSHVGD
ncbi:MAG TPA: ABC transporter permease [Xanthobacteraceae bacterium]|nr:ABC transporter permease [Xanthobacteraceae bacterium]